MEVAVRPGSESPPESVRQPWIGAVAREHAAPSIRWAVYAMVFASACITAGILWDISWHATIGRDTFWTPAHMLIYLGGSLGGCLGGWLAWDATFRRREAWQSQSVGILGGRAPLGAMVAIWGAVAMLTSAPFDDWWHNAYGLDVKILSPPHSLLAAGMYGVVVGAVLLAAADRNRAAATGTCGVAPGLVVAALGIQMALAAILLTEVSYPNGQHTGTFYLASAAMYPTFLLAAAHYSPTRWMATKVALAYMLVSAVMVWLLPLFPAEPKLAPIYNPVTHLVPPPFPLLLVAPALAIDLLFLALRNRSGWGWGAVRILGAVTLFTGVFVAVQWNFSAFLISPAADNAFFAGHGRFFGYMSRRDDWRGTFWRPDHEFLKVASLGWMWLIALGAGLLGSGLGAFLGRIRR